MSKMSPKAKALYDKYDKEWFAERVVKLETENKGLWTAIEYIAHDSKDRGAAIARNVIENKNRKIIEAEE